MFRPPLKFFCWPFRDAGYDVFCFCMVLWRQTAELFSRMLWYCTCNNVLCTGFDLSSIVTTTAEKMAAGRRPGWLLSCFTSYYSSFWCHRRAAILYTARRASHILHVCFCKVKVFPWYALSYIFPTFEWPVIISVYINRFFAAFFSFFFFFFFFNAR